MTLLCGRSAAAPPSRPCAGSLEAASGRRVAAGTCQTTMNRITAGKGAGALDPVAVATIVAGAARARPNEASTEVNATAAGATAMGVAAHAKTTVIVKETGLGAVSTAGVLST